ncbi:DUF421 domain-containing protein [Mesobacillus selenatarsenatis]|uniref:YetF C-terminal domain-containing protein n=1 Tax=Mesobacillus selenatarsenatis (strain DSM 18680 / JCM 14380 / FERM P-15431 / SF-1) TaxID=1321606 RepID=A0A0A8XCG2_MESS1|nr:DUF421 domain-containing protein [Mesobacillus selenatarsenatis]GAM16717.1 hypothetical protein SAMD00020551_4947 [Mesobacillus selenatarsenatis SF-1]
MDLHFIWKAVVIVIGGVLILRLAGRKSVSQLTVAQTVMMVAVGSLIIQPVSERNIWITLVITLLMVITLIFIEYITLKYNVMETFIYGKSRLVVENGQLNEANLKKLRLTVDMLEVRLRQQNIKKFSDLQWATIESNGQLGFMLKPEKQYATKEDIQMLKSLIEGSQPSPPNMNNKSTPASGSDDIFKEVKNQGHSKGHPEKLE